MKRTAENVSPDENKISPKVIIENACNLDGGKEGEDTCQQNVHTLDLNIHCFLYNRPTHDRTRKIKMAQEESTLP
jgi:hypothetical protein